MRLAPAGLIALGGCTDYAGVATLSAGMERTVDGWRPFADDYAATCARRVQLDPRPAADPNARCHAAKEAQRGLDGALDLLRGYFDALGAVADGARFSLDAGLADAGGSAVLLVHGADAQARAGAIEALAEEMARLAVARLRERTMARLIDQIPRVAILIDAIQQVIDRDYAGNLQAEAETWRQTMAVPAHSAGLPAPPPCIGGGSTWGGPPLAGASAQQVLFRAFYDDRCEAIRARAEAVAAFDGSAAAARRSLAALAANHAHLGDRATALALIAEGRTLLIDAQAVAHAFDGERARE